MAIKYLLKVKDLAGDPQIFSFSTKHNRAMALNDMVKAGLITDHAMSQTKNKPCPECEEISLSYIRNQTLQEGIARYYTCRTCGAEIRIKLCTALLPDLEGAQCSKTG